MLGSAASIAISAIPTIMVVLAIMLFVRFRGGGQRTCSSCGKTCVPRDPYVIYCPSCGKQIARVHGPFVSDEEVRAVAEHWKSQGTPDYVMAVTEEPEDGGYTFEGQPTGEDDAETQLYKKAIQIVAESQKASTSYLQRQLRVGYNSAARLIERMEKDGLVGQPDHVGRREVLIDPDGHPI